MKISDNYANSIIKKLHDNYLMKRDNGDHVSLIYPHHIIKIYPQHLLMQYIDSDMTLNTDKELLKPSEINYINMVLQEGA